MTRQDDPSIIFDFIWPWSEKVANDVHAARKTPALSIRTLHLVSSVRRMKSVFLDVFWHHILPLSRLQTTSDLWRFVSVNLSHEAHKFCPVIIHGVQVIRSSPQIVSVRHSIFVLSYIPHEVFLEVLDICSNSRMRLQRSIYCSKSNWSIIDHWRCLPGRSSWSCHPYKNIHFKIKNTKFETVFIFRLFPTPHNKHMFQ